MKHLITAKCYNKHGDLLGYATNHYTKSHPLQAHFAKMVGHPERIYLHAEIAAILQCGTQQIHTLVVVRRRKSSAALALAKPCPICQEAIKAFKIKKVLYSTNEETMERL